MPDADAAEARRLLRAGMYYTPMTTPRPEMTMNETTPPDDITAAVDKALAAVRCAGRPAAGTDLHALAEAWVQGNDDAGVLICRMAALRVQLGECRRRQGEAATALGTAAFAGHGADVGESRAVAGGTGVVVVRVTGDAGEPFACEFVPSAK